MQMSPPKSSQQKVRKSSTRADDIVRRRGYSDHFVTMYVCMCVCVDVYVSTIQRKLLVGMT